MKLERPDEDAPPAYLPDTPMVYLACALSSVNEKSKEELEADCRLIVKTVVEAGLEAEREIMVYDPISQSAPWAGRPPRTGPEIWELNTNKVLVEADALIVHGFQGGSFGVGHEGGMAHARGIPILYVHHESTKVSLQVRGMPAFLEIGPFSDREALRDVVLVWLDRWRKTIELGPRYRRSQELSFRPLWDDLRLHWAEVAGQGAKSERRMAEISSACRMSVDEISDVLRHPLKVASMPAAKLLLLGAALDIVVSAYFAALLGPRELPITEWKALRNAQHENGWGDEFTQVIQNVGRVAKERDAAIVSRLDLEEAENWELLAKAWMRGEVS